MSEFAFERAEWRVTTTVERRWTPEIGTTDAGTEVETKRTVFVRYTVSGLDAVSLYRDGGQLHVPVGVRVSYVGVPLSTKDTNVTVLCRLQKKGGGLGEAIRELHRYSWSRSNDPAWLISVIADAMEVPS